MQLENFSRTWIPIIQAAIGLLGLCSLALVWWQIRRTNYWNRMNFLNSINSSSMELERRVLLTTKSLGIDLNRSALTKADVAKIWDSESDEAFYSIKEYLGIMENLCVGISFGAAHLDLAYSLHSVRIMSTYDLFRAFIEQMRATQQSDEIYLALETVADDFRRRQTQELARRK